MLMAVFLIIGVFPVTVAADESTDSIGKIHVIVENNTAKIDSVNFDKLKWLDDAKPWFGTLLDVMVDLYEDDTAVSVVNRAVTGKGYSINDSNGSYISEIAGLKADGSAGWMATINDWFTNEMLQKFKPSAEDSDLIISDGDEIRMVYSLVGGSDVGSIPNDTTKTLASVDITGATLGKTFSPGGHDYELVIGDVDSADVTLVPTAYNKNFQVRVYKGDYNPDKAGYKRGQTISVKPDDVITVVVGHPDWPSMNNGAYGGAEKVEAGIYTFRAVKTAGTPEVSFDSFFITALDGVATVTNDPTYPWEYDKSEDALVSTNAGKSKTDAGITFKFTAPAKLSFKYKASSETRYDYLKISKNETVLNGDYSVKADFSGEMTEYKEYSIEADTGDVIVLAYSKDTSGDKNSDCVWLKNFTVSLPNTLTLHSNDEKNETFVQGIFGTGTIRENPFVREKLRFDGWAETPDGEIVHKSGDTITLTENYELWAVWTKLWYLTFPDMPNGAKISVSKDGTEIAPESDGRWLLPDGEYTMKASCFGYLPSEKAITINGADLVSYETLTISERFTLSFDVTPKNASVEVKNSDGTVMTAKNGVYSLPAGEYSYIVKASGYKAAKGNVTISKNETVTIELVTTRVWDGETLTEPAIVDGIYQISNGAELEWFAKQVNDGNSALNAILVGDIELGDEDTVRNHTPIGNSKNNAYTGHFNGAGYSITCLHAAGTEYVGLFGYVGEGAVIERVILENADVSGKSNVGGIAGYSEGEIIACAVSGAVTQNAVYSSGAVGGIVGQNKGTISYSKNSASIIRGNNSNSSGYLGGIAGYNYSGTIESCYNIGEISEANYAGGIAGRNTGAITNSFSTGKLGGTSYGNSAVIGYNGYGSSSKVENCYYSDSCGVSDSKAEKKTADEMKTLASLLGGAFTDSAEHPILKWEDPNSSYTIKITVSPENADVVLKKNDGTITGTSENGVYTFSVKAGEYEYSVSCGDEDYAPQSGKLSIGYSDVSVEVKLVINRYDVSFTLDPTDAELVVKKGDEVVSPEKGVYKLPNGEYSYTVTAFGYETANGSFTVDHADLPLNVTLTKKSGGNVTFAITSDNGFANGNPTITVTHTGSGKEFSFTNNEAKFLPDGDYTYTVKAPTLGKLAGSFKVNGAAQTINGEMFYSDTWDGVTVVEPKLVNDIYQISNGYELAWYRDYVNSKTSGSDFYSVKGAILTADINLGENNWVPIFKYVKPSGSYSSITSASSGYVATFDGNGHKISGLNVNMSDQGAGLFGIVYTKGVVKNLTVEGNVVGSQYAAGIVAALNGGTVENCVNNATVTGSGKTNAFLGGVVGVMGNSKAASSTVSDCVNNGILNGGENSYVGGIIGNASYGIIVENCVNNGSVNGSASVGGIYGNGAVSIIGCVNKGTITATGNSVGGIAGFLGKDSSVSWSYNTGNVSGGGSKEGVGGIVGQLHSAYGAAVDSVLNTGSVSATGSFYGSVVGAKGDDTSCVTNAYYLASGIQAIGSKAAEDENPTAVTAAELKSPLLAAKLGGFFAYKDGAEAPVLDFEDADAKYVTAFDVTPEGASVVVKKDGTAVAPHSDKIYFLEDGDYSYEISLSKYNTVTGELTVASMSQCVFVALEKETFAVNFTVEPSDAKITITQNGVLVSDSAPFRLPNGSYDYKIEKFGYLTATGSFTVEDAGVNIPEISLVKLDSRTITFAPDLGESEAEYEITVKSGETIVATTSGDPVTLPDGDYTFVCVAPGFFDYKGGFSVKGENLTINFEMPLRTTWDGTTKTKPKLVDGVYRIGSAEELAWFADFVNAGNTAVNAILLADIHINDEFTSNTWTEIGGYSNQYNGTFDGNGHTVYDLDKPLFGLNAKDSLVKNLTVTGTYNETDINTSNAGGICRTSYGGFENCVNKCDVSIKRMRVGGIVGILYKGGYIRNCANYGEITTSIAGESNSAKYAEIAYLGGIVGYAYGEVSGCANYGKVSATGENYGGIGGIAGVSDSTITNSYNNGTVSGLKRVGGIVGIQNAVGSSTSNCYNVGTVICTNTKDTSGKPFCGAIAGSIANDKSATIGSVSDCWYLENSFYQKRAGTIHNGGVGYGTDNTVSMTSGEMKTDLFVVTLGDAFNTADEGQNDGYPVLKWQGGHEPNVAQDELDVVSDLAGLTVTPTEIRSAITLELALTGEKGSSIVWSSDNTAVVANNGVVTLPSTGSSVVTLTASATKGEYTKTKTFKVTVYSLASTSTTELSDLLKSIQGQVIAEYGKDTTLLDALKRRITAKLGSYTTITSADDITYSITSTGTPSEGCGVSADGTIQYYYIDPAATFSRFGYSKDVTVKLSLNGAEREHTFRLFIPWDRAKVIAAMTPALETLTFDAIKGENTSADDVKTALSLPYNPDGYSWIINEWSSDHDEIISVVQNGTEYITTVTLPQNDTTVNLKVTLNFNKSTEKEPPITLEKTFTFTAKGESGSRAEQMRRALDAYTLDKLKDFDTKEPIDPNAVTNDIQLPRPDDLGVGGGEYLVEASITGNSKVNGFNLMVARPLPGGADTEAVLTVKITHKKSGDFVTKTVGTIKIKALTENEINSEISLMADAKARFFDAIKGENKRPDYISKNLHAFREITRGENGELIYIYNFNDTTGNGVKPDDCPGYDPMAFPYRTFMSSDNSVITHENLLVSRAGTRKTVTVTAWLSSEKFARYAELYPDDERFAGLSKQVVTAELTVIASDESETDWRDIYDSALDYIESNVTPSPASISGEWAVLALARSGVENKAWYLSYVNSLKSKLASGEITAVNDATRAAIALTALGEDASDFEGCNLFDRILAKNGDKYLTEKSGNTALAFALIALDTKPYEGDSYDAARNEIISLLLANQLDSGAWYINDENPDENVDATAMVITSLAKYRDRTNVKTAVDNALGWLASKYDNGFGTTESDAQLLVALTALGIDPENDARFGGLIASLISNAMTSGGFRHDRWTSGVNEMSTEQAAYALAAYSRFLNNKNRLYDMSDAELMFPSSKVQTIIDLIKDLTVTDCSRATSRQINAIKELYDALSVGEKSKVTNYSDFLAKSETFDKLLSGHKASLTRKLNEAFEKLDSGDYSSSFWNELERAFRNGLYEIDSATCSEDADAAANKAIAALNAKESTLISVDFSLIGDYLHGDDGHDSYVTWIPGTSYLVQSGSTVYDLFVRALSDYGMDSEGASGGYVSAIKAPAEFGGFWLGEFDNGSGSGWVYSVNGSYPEVALTDYTLSDGDSVVWSYIDNYKDIFPDYGGDDDDGNDPSKDDDKPADPEVKLPFTDIDGHWSYDNIAKMYELGLMNGVGGTLFAPDMPLTRAMFVTILWRLDGGKSDEKVPFTDVEDGTWYSEAVAWGYANGIVNGTSETTFSPDDAISREQLAVMLIRYAEFRKLTLSDGTDLTKFTDSGEISSWASDALSLAVGNGIMNGRSDKVLDPLGKASRAECAAMVVRFLNLIEAGN